MDSENDKKENVKTLGRECCMKTETVKSPCLPPTPPPQSQSISLLCDFPETRFSFSDRQLIPPLASGLYLNAPSWGRDPTAHTEGISSILLFHLSCPLTLLFLASLTASRDGAVGEGRSGERVGWYLLSTGFAGNEAVFLQRQGMNITCR